MSTPLQINTTDSLKDYYVKLQGLYENAVNILTAINQSLVSNASEITVDIADTDDTTTTVRIPSFLYMENKIEQLENNFNNLFELPNSGDAWFTKSQDMIKLKMVRSNTAPLSPVMQLNNVYASITDNNFMNDLVSPKTFLKLNVTNLPDNIESMFMKKVVIYSKTLFDELNSANIQSYSDLIAALYNYKANVDYKEYDSVLDLPIKKDTYNSSFKIIDIPEINNSTNPWVDESYGNHKHLSYKICLDTLEYSDEENSAISFTLKAGDYICLGNEMVVYKVKNVDLASNTIIIEETIGHISLQTYQENSEMIFTLYNENYGRWNYVEVPLEENQYICIFLGTIYNNVRSLLSAPYFVDLSTIVMKDANGNIMKDGFGNDITYLDYYNEYCVNIGDLIKGLTESAYPQISNYTPIQLNLLQSSEQIKDVVSLSISGENVLQVVPINKHLTNDSTSEEIINLHAQKNDLNAQLDTLRDNINDTYNTMLNTDFSQTTSVSWQSMQSQINNYYTERTTIQKQLSAVIDNINSKSTDLKGVGDEIKYRIRGITTVDSLENLLHSIANDKCDIIGMDVEYKYKSTSKDTSSLTVINSSTFTDWNKLNTIDRQRHLVFDKNINSYKLEYVDYAKTDNIIKWNQIDIPIQSGEDVIIRVRYKLNIGQPFVNIYTPWSDEFTVIFPDEYNDDIELKSIITTNANDTINASFNNTLINEGYQEHIQNKIAAADSIFFHQPDNIYSGFTTSENNLISLKDKLYSMSQDIERYKTLIDNEANSKFSVYLAFDEQNVELSPNTINNINIYNTDHITGNFIRKEMNLIIKNTGSTPINLYSIFPGNTSIPLILSDIEFYNEYITNYERVPMIVDNTIAPQYLGQWIYFRQNNPYTKRDVYYNTEKQRADDINAISNPDAELLYDAKAIDYMNANNAQVLLGFRKRKFSLDTDYNTEKINKMLETLKQFGNLTASFYKCYNKEIIVSEEAKEAVNSAQNIIDAFNILEKDSNANYINNSDENSNFRLSVIQHIYNDKQLNEYFGSGQGSLNIFTAVSEWFSNNYSYTYDGEEKLAKEIFVKIFNLCQNELNSKRLKDVKETISKIETEINKINEIKAVSNDDYKDKDFKWFVYSNSLYRDNGEENKYLMRYEDIQGKNESQQTVFLDNATSILSFFNKYKPKGFNTEKDFCGAFVYPNLNNKNVLMTDGGEKDSISIDVSGSITIPIVFEYYLDGTNYSSITKSMYFDIRNSLIRNPLHYMIEITGNYDFTATGDIYNNFSAVELSDSVTS